MLPRSGPPQNQIPFDFQTLGEEGMDLFRWLLSLKHLLITAAVLTVGLELSLSCFRRLHGTNCRTKPAGAEVQTLTLYTAGASNLRNTFEQTGREVGGTFEILCGAARDARLHCGVYAEVKGSIPKSRKSTDTNEAGESGADSRDRLYLACVGQDIPAITCLGFVRRVGPIGSSLI